MIAFREEAYGESDDRKLRTSVPGGWRFAEMERWRRALENAEPECRMAIGSLHREGRPGIVELCVFRNHRSRVSWIGDGAGRELDFRAIDDHDDGEYALWVTDDDVDGDVGDGNGFGGGDGEHQSSGGSGVFQPGAGAGESVFERAETGAREHGNVPLVSGGELDGLPDSTGVWR